MGKRHWILIAALAAAAAGASMPAAAQTSWSVHIGVPGPVYAQPVYPQPVYVQPAPVVVYERERAWAPGYRDWHGHGNAHGWGAHRAHGRGDRDGDGVPNRWDRAPRNPYRY